jgi:hypothetical protein
MVIAHFWEKNRKNLLYFCELGLKIKQKPEFYTLKVLLNIRLMQQKMGFAPKKEATQAPRGETSEYCKII